MGPRLVLQELALRLWSNRDLYGLTCSLQTVPGVRSARIPVDMTPVDSSSFTTFADRMRSARGIDVLELRWRDQFCRAGIETLYVTYDQQGSPAFTQWLIDGRELERARHPLLEGYPELADGQVLLEAAYTFPEARRQGLMSAGKTQVLGYAREQGATSVLVYVSVDNVASLRGNAAAGLLPDHIRRQRVRFGRRSFTFHPVDPAAMAHWHRVTGR